MAALGSLAGGKRLPRRPAFQYWREQPGAGWWFCRRGPIATSSPTEPRWCRGSGSIRRPGTAAEGSLWTEEFLPPETLLYALAGVNLPAETPSYIKKATDLTDWVKDLASGHLQVGSGRTLGHGIVRAVVRSEDHPSPPGPANPARSELRSWTSRQRPAGRSCRHHEPHRSLAATRGGPRLIADACKPPLSARYVLAPAAGLPGVSSAWAGADAGLPAVAQPVASPTVLTGCSLGNSTGGCSHPGGHGSVGAVAVPTPGQPLLP